jgi:ABC-2 type transport system permease protein
MTAVWRRELKSYFHTPLGYVFLGVFLLLTGIFFLSGNLLSLSANMGILFDSMSYLFMLIMPLLTMRLLSEERRSGTDRLLLTSPLPIGAIVAGKYLAAVTVLALAAILTMPCAAILFLYASPHAPLIASGYLGFFLLGASYIAIGVLMSAVTESQLTAAVATFCANLMIQFLESVGPSLDIPLMPWLGSAIGWMSLYDRYYSFTAGLISVADIVYFLSLIGVVLFLTVRVIDKRRWQGA